MTTESRLAGITLVATVGFLGFNGTALADEQSTQSRPAAVPGVATESTGGGGRLGVPRAMSRTPKANKAERFPPPTLGGRDDGSSPSQQHRVG